MEIICENAVNLLPFISEPLISFDRESDLAKYLTQLFDKTGTMITPEGNEVSFSYAFYGFYRLEEGIEQFKIIANKFQEDAQKVLPTPAAKNNVESIPNFKKDFNFGHMAKCAIAWDSTVSAVLSENAYFSLAHVLEAASDLNCSILLSSNLYYKQALQVLRSYVEGMTIQLYFCQNMNQFEKWKNGQFRTPPIRGKNGILKKLISSGLLSNNLAELISDLYRDLNESIHGSEKRLIHQGLFEGNWTGLLFQYSRFEEWSKYYTQCVYIGIPLFRLIVNYWNKISAKQGIVCKVCHKNNFDIKKINISDKHLAKLICCNCGNKMTIDAEKLTSLSISSKDILPIVNAEDNNNYIFIK